MEDPEAKRLSMQVASDLWAASRQWVRHPGYYDQVREWMAVGWLGWRDIKRRDGDGMEAD